MQELTIVSFVLNFILIIVTTIYVVITARLAKSAKEQVEVSKTIHRANKIELRVNNEKTPTNVIKQGLHYLRSIFLATNH